MRTVERDGRTASGVGLLESAPPAEAVRFDSTQTRTERDGPTSHLVRVLRSTSVAVRVGVFDPRGVSPSAGFSLSAALAKTPVLDPPQRS